MQTDRNQNTGNLGAKSLTDDRYIDDTDSDWNVNQSVAASSANRNEDRDKDRYSDDRTKNTDKSHDKDSKTFNEDEESWDNRKDAETTTSNKGTEDNDWDQNDAMQRGTASRYFDDSQNYKTSSRYDEYDEHRDAAAGDYINSDHSEYNRGNDRFRWDEPQDEE